MKAFFSFVAALVLSLSMAAQNKKTKSSGYLCFIAVT